MTSTQRSESELLTALAKASTTAEQQVIVAELEAGRAERRAQAQAVEADMFAAEAVRFPVADSERFTSTAASDWLDDIEVPQTDRTAMEHKMRAEATLWLERRPEAVRADGGEFRTQAVNKARYLSNHYPGQRTAAEEAFLDQIKALAAEDWARPDDDAVTVTEADEHEEVEFEGGPEVGAIPSSADAPSIPGTPEGDSPMNSGTTNPNQGANHDNSTFSRDNPDAGELTASRKTAARECNWTYLGDDDGGNLHWWECTTHGKQGVGGPPGDEPSFPCEGWLDENDAERGPYTASRKTASFARKTAGAKTMGEMRALMGYDFTYEMEPDEVPSDFEVQPLTTDAEVAAAVEPAIDGHCGLIWDDGKSTSLTPAPSGRCPFEYFHGYEDEDDDHFASRKTAADKPYDERAAEEDEEKTSNAPDEEHGPVEWHTKTDNVKSSRRRKMAAFSSFEELEKHVRGLMAEHSDLVDAAEAAYERQDQGWFNSQSIETLRILWEIAASSFFVSWDDEVHEALSLHNFDFNTAFASRRKQTRRTLARVDKAKVIPPMGYEVTREDVEAAMALPSGSRPRIYAYWDNGTGSPQVVKITSQHYLDKYGPDVEFYWGTNATMDNIGEWMVSRASRKTAVSLSNVGIESETVAFGTDPSGNKVRFKITPSEHKQLKDVLYSDLAVNFSGVDVSEDEIIREGRRNKVSNRRVAHNGWTNWDTWNAAMWINNVEGIYRAALGTESPEALRNLVEDFGLTGDGFDSDKVNWREVWTDSEFGPNHQGSRRTAADFSWADRTASRRKTAREAMVCMSCGREVEHGDWDTCPHCGSSAGVEWETKESSRKVTAGFDFNGEEYYVGIVGVGGSPKTAQPCQRCGREVFNQEAYVTAWAEGQTQKVLCRPCGNDVERGVTASRKQAAVGDPCWSCGGKGWYSTTSYDYDPYEGQRMEITCSTCGGSGVVNEPTDYPLADDPIFTDRYSSLADTARMGQRRRRKQAATYWIYEVQAVAESGQPRTIDGIRVEPHTAQSILDAASRDGSITQMPFSRVFDAAVGATFASRKKARRASDFSWAK